MARPRRARQPNSASGLHIGHRESGTRLAPRAAGRHATHPESAGHCTRAPIRASVLPRHHGGRECGVARRQIRLRHGALRMRGIVIGRTLAVLAVVVIVAAVGAAGAEEPPGPNTGRLSLNVGVDFPSRYYFRGILQEKEDYIIQPFADLTFKLYENKEGALSAVNL